MRAWLAALVFGVSAHAQTALSRDQSELLDSTRSLALQYSQSLPNFLCTETVRRSEDQFGGGRWRLIDTLKIKVTYSGREDYQLVTRNGVAAGGDYSSVGGAISAGEFGSRLADIFAIESAAEFAWKGWGRVRRHRVAVYTYRIDGAHSRNVVRYGGQNEPGAKSITPGFHGEISVDPDSGHVLRVTLSADLPNGFPITDCSTWTEYDYRAVAGSTYLVPVESETKVVSGRYQASNHIAFDDYRKFGSDATITFK
jgi:hypothetical protein